MKNISIWKDNIKSINYKKLDKNLDIDILIIGGGITGISTLYHLKDSNLKIILVEQNKIGLSTTGNSTGKLSYLQNDLLDKIRKNFTDEIASRYLKSQLESINMIVNIIKKEDINCDLEKTKSYLYTNKENEIDKIKNLEKFLINNNIKVYHSNINILKSKYMISVNDTYTFHPIKFIQELSTKCNHTIYENTSILKIKKDKSSYICYTDKYTIKAKKIIIASHFPYFILPFLFPIKGCLEKSYLSASKAKTKPISLISYSNPFISIRNYKDYLIYLSNSHSINKDTCDKKHYQELLTKINKLNLKSDYLWSNIDIITNDGLPYIGEIKKNLFIGTGYNTWGLTTGFLAGKILSDIILEKENEYIPLFFPKRKNLNQILGSLNNMGKSISGYLDGLLNKNNKIKYDKINDKYILIYNNHIVYENCPHMGCKLIFNEIENTFDCPCHGSRFDINGKCIQSPANKDINIKKNESYKS